ncbi:MAG: HEAT repeat domain-containing protein [Cyanobacteriota bacterium]|nr:HEAT repeat domain-containing protein [Cyanobacteriota bacterium]
MVDPVTTTLMLAGPIVSELAKGALEDYVKDFFIGSIEGFEALAQKPFAKNAVKDALEEFATLFAGELVGAGLGKREIKPFVEPLKAFVRDKEVRQVLGTAFSADCQQVDGAKLAERWQQVKYGGKPEWKLKGTPKWWRDKFPEACYGKPLPYLPAGFEWQRLGEAYRQKVREIVRDDAELRAVLDSQNLERIAEATITNAPIPAEFDLETYREGLLEQYDDLDLDSLSAGIGEDDRRLTVRDVFVAQMARTCQEYLPGDYELPKDVQARLRERGEMAAALAEAEVERYQRAYMEQSPRSILEIIDESRYPFLVVLGDPGSGKSTLLKYLALKWAKLSPQERVSAPVPLLIELRKYVQNKEEGECSNFLEFIESGSGWVGHLPKRILHDELKRGRGMVLFDGLDEVFDPNRRSQVVAQIHDFTQDYPNVKTLVTSRVIGYQQQRLKRANFHHVMLQDFTPEQVAEFIRRWHDLAYRDGRKKAAKRERLENAIAQSRAIRELTANPLLLTMMAILNRNQELPRNRTKLYEEASKVLLYKWDVEGKVKLAHEKLDPDIFDEALKQKICRAIAYRMQLGEQGLQGNIISREELREAIAECLTGVVGNQATVFAKLIIEQLRQRDFILCRLGGHNEDYFGFVHRTFLEYFCAWAFVWQFEKERSIEPEDLKTEVFGKHWQEESWHEVLRLMAGMLDGKFVGEMVEYLLGQKDGKFVNVFLAAECLGEVKSRGEIGEIDGKVRNRLEELTGYGVLIDRPRSSWDWEDNDRIREIRTQAVSTLAEVWKDDPDTLPWLKDKARNDEDSDVRQAAVQELARGWKDDPDTLPWLKDKAQNDENWAVRQAAVQELARGWKDDPDTLPILKDKARNDENEYVRRAAVQELARGWKDDPDTLPWLKDKARNDEDSDVRQAAVQELARGWKDDPDTLPILQDKAQNDENEWVRLVAVQELARGWKDDPDTLPILQDKAQNDEDSVVRQVAVQELARGWKDDPDTLPWLKDKAQNDENEWVRRVAVQELARGWKDDRDTLPLLKDKAQNDENWAVRQAAVQELARGWKDEPGMFELLSQITRTDAFDRSNDFQYNPRRTALEAILKSYPDRPEIFELLRDRSANDTDEQLRQFAQEKLAERESTH